MNSYPTPAYLAEPARTHHSLPLSSRQDAELQWEMNHRELHASLVGLPSSSFARTMLEEDDLFYATFPGARRAAIDLWASENLMQGPYVEALAPQPHFATLKSPTAAMPHTHHAQSSVNHPTYDIPHLNHLEARPSSLQLNYMYYAVDPQPNTAPPFVDHQALVTQGQGSRVTPDVYHIREQSSIPKPLPPPSPEIVRTAPHLLVPSQRRGGVQLPPTLPQLELADHLLSPSFSNTANTPPCSPRSARPAFSSSPDVPSPASSSVVPLQFSVDWEADAIAAEKLRTASQPSHPTHGVVPSMNQQDTPLTNTHVPRHSLAHRKHQATRSRSHLYSSSMSCSPLVSRASPSRTRNPVKLPRTKDGKPAMACLFCRGRKIARGLPLPRSNSLTCNQCECRHLKCEYPAVNHRGMRRKKDEGDAVDAKKKDKGGISGEAKKDNGDRVVNPKKDDRDQAVDTNSASKRTPSISSAKPCPMKAEYSEPEDVAMSDIDDSSSEWDSDD